MTLPVNVGKGWVVGVFMDTAGTLADGTVTFTPSPSKFLDVSSSPPATILPSPVTANVVAGVLQQQLVATDDLDLNPVGWTYQVSFKLKIGGAAVSITPFSIGVPEGNLASAVDLALVAPVGSSGGTQIIRGWGIPPVEDGLPGQAVVLSPDGLTTEWGDVAVGSLFSTDIVDSTVVGRNVITAANAAAARSAIGAAGDVAVDTHAAPSKTTPIDADELPLVDSAASFGLKRLTFLNLKNWIKSWITSTDVGAQPLDTDLTAIAALSTTTYGRALLTLADQAGLTTAVRTASTTATGVVELATTAEDKTGTDATRGSTPAGVKAAIDQRIDNTAGLSTNSTTNAPSIAAAKAYVDGILDANNAYQYKGVIDASTNPNYPAASAGHTYKISVAGKIGGASGPNVEVGDSITALVDGSAAGTQAAVGANWIILQTNIDGAVTGPASSTAANLPSFSGTTGKVIADSGFAPSNAAIGAGSATTLPTSAQVVAYAQPLDSDLTAIAALTTTSYGRAFLALANQAALMALLSAATTSAAGIVELATTLETTTGTDTTRAVTPAGLDAALDLKANVGDSIVISQTFAGSVAFVKHNGTSWPARPTARTDISVIYQYPLVSTPDPVDFIAGVDYAWKPTS